jgi:hypothetical protein
MSESARLKSATANARPKTDGGAQMSALVGVHDAVSELLLSCVHVGESQIDQVNSDPSSPHPCLCASHRSEDQSVLSVVLS